MTVKSNPSSISQVAFDCLHCGAYASQTWFDVHASQLTGEIRTPTVLGHDDVERMSADHDIPDEGKQRLLEYVRKVESGLPFFDRHKGKYVYSDVNNLHLSQCFACGEISVWVHDKPIFPSISKGPAPNPDLPLDVRRDYEEASQILDMSPRGAAALLRLGIQKLCLVLGEKGRNIDEDIASLVKKGLSPLIQKALDSVRVIGNEAVHPGKLDLKDDRETAHSLFKIVNVIAEQMISNPKHIEELYGKIPEEKRKAIDNRDGKGAVVA